MIPPIASRFVASRRFETSGRYFVTSGGITWPRPVPVFVSGEFDPMTVLVGATFLSYCLWQLLFDPFQGPIPGRTLALVALASGIVAGIGLMAWGFYRLDLLRRP
jgi:hypothetical protein